MKVLMINGSRREKFCTYTALSVVADALKENGVDSEIVFIGDKVLNGNINETVKMVAEKLKTADGLVIGSPVYYASPSGEVLAFLDRLFFNESPLLMFKPAAAVCSARRGGTTACIDVLNKYFMITQMPIVSSTYWNMVHGNSPEEVMQDEEGVQIMRNIGRNMAWLLKCIEAGRKNGIEIPAPEDKKRTNFIR
jgi:multimeric flavodoxin WrbA